MARMKRIAGKEAMIRSGKKYGTTVTYEDGTQKVFLTPYGKGAKYAHELRLGHHVTNDGQVKVYSSGKNKGKAIPLSEKAKSYRSGFLQARTDAANAWKAGRKGSK